MTGPLFFHRSKALLVVLIATVFALMLPTGSASAEDPPGNNGTIKLDGVDFDTHVDNEPHVGCVFQLDFYGYDQGDLTARIRFLVIPPTGSNVTIRTSRVFIGEDPAGGGTDLDASKTFNLSAALAAFDPHPQQGYHVKVVVNAPDSIGADKKYKAFWVDECAVVNS